jgi:hypothetical protein
MEVIESKFISTVFEKCVCFIGIHISAHIILLNVSTQYIFLSSISLFVPMYFYAGWIS